jgi:tetratricopeptide (TPR) repeat protein
MVGSPDRRGGKPSRGAGAPRPASSSRAGGGRTSATGRGSSSSGRATGGSSSRQGAAASRARRSEPSRERAPRPEPRSRRSADLPAVPEGLQVDSLDPDVRRSLRSLPKGLADEVGARLVAARDLLESEPETAHAHAQEAARVASRIAVTREALGLTAYATGRWAQARSELRAARRLSGSDEYLPVIADCERGLGKPVRALELAGSPEAARLDRPGQVEMRIVASGARRDLGQHEAAVLTLQCPELRDANRPWSARLRYAYADALLAAGRTDEAVDWFGRAANSDPDGETDAAERLDELTGTVFTDVTDPDDPDDPDRAGEGAGGPTTT